MSKTYFYKHEDGRIAVHFFDGLKMRRMKTGDKADDVFTFCTSTRARQIKNQIKFLVSRADEKGFSDDYVSRALRTFLTRKTEKKKKNKNKMPDYSLSHTILRDFLTFHYICAGKPVSVSTKLNCEFMYQDETTRDEYVKIVEYAKKLCRKKIPADEFREKIRNYFDS